MVEGRIDDANCSSLGVLVLSDLVERLLLITTSDNNGVAAAIIEEVIANAEVSELTAIRGVIEEELIGMGVEIGMAAEIEGISV